jgi:hypothetical protein
MNRRWKARHLVRWTVLSAVPSVLLFLHAHRASAALIGLIDNGQIVVSDDVGASWETRGVLAVPDAIGLVALTSNTVLYLLTRSGTVYASSNSGADWDAVGGVPASDVAAVGVRDDLALLTLTESGTVRESEDGGETFATIGTLNAVDCVSLATGPGIAYALTRTGSVFASLDGGATWTVRGSIPVSDAIEVVRTGDALYIVSGTGDVWRSVNAGVSWFPVGTLSQVHVSGLVWDGSTLAAVTREGMVARSQDGVGWQWVGAINQLNVVALATDTPVVAVFPGGGPGVGLAVGAVHPNPTTGPRCALTFPVQLTGRTMIRVFLYDVSGRLVAARTAESLEGPGLSHVTWEPGALSAGVYVAKVRTNTESIARRIVVIQ